MWLANGRDSTASHIRWQKSAEQVKQLCQCPELPQRPSAGDNRSITPPNPHIDGLLQVRREEAARVFDWAMQKAYMEPLTSKHVRVWIHVC